ncbi:MAG: hypothetical protein ACI9EW_000560, partial [Cellvibrionaceae bacterium]
MFNRLWIRIALTFAIVQISFVLLPFGVFVALNEFGILEYRDNDVELSAIFEDSGISPEQQHELLRRFRHEMRSRLPGELIQIAVLSGLVGSIAGVLVSRRLTRPLNNLETGAENI